ncbi:MAG: hypothetical protein GEV12_15080 [Micromonosporaceae bacterium]|nr:hypothetical protein [Micromonosporaceae bacterium]
MQDGQRVQATQRGDGRGRTDGHRATAAQPINPPLDRPAPDGQAPITGVTGATPLNPRAHDASEHHERDEQDQGGDRHRCSALLSMHRLAQPPIRLAILTRTPPIIRHPDLDSATFAWTGNSMTPRPNVEPDQPVWRCAS